MIPFGVLPFGNLPIGNLPFGELKIIDYFCQMKSPFVFGKVVTENSFINRTKEIERLTGNFTSHLNSILISPRRWGKSSLVRRTAIELTKQNPNVVFCFLDLFRIRSEEEFYKQFTTEVVKSTADKIDELMENVKGFLNRLSPRLSFGADPMNDFQLTFELSSDKKDLAEILNLPEKIATKKKIHIIVGIDEFQNIGNYKESLEFQKLLRSIWQHHQHVSYCLYGSKRHMMMELFESQSMPFYKFGDVMFLQKIKKEHFIQFIIVSFARTKKSVSKKIAEKLVNSVENHPYYVQQLSHITWTNCGGKLSNKILDESLDDLIEQNSILYQQIANDLSDTQINFLIALSDGATNFNSSEVMHKYSLGTSANVTKLKKVLTRKEIIDNSNGITHFIDPVLKLWMVRTFLN